jgi:hypothetical protein
MQVEIRATAKGAQRRGVGSQLLAELEGHARTRGSWKLAVKTSPTDGSGATEFYLHNGYDVSKELVRHEWLSGKIWRWCTAIHEKVIFPSMMQTSGDEAPVI